MPAHRIDGPSGARGGASPGGEPDAAERGGVGAPGAYLSAIARAGGTPVLVVPQSVVGPDGRASGDAARDLLGRMDAMVLPGGRDIDPARYGREPHRRSDAPDAERDELEIGLALAAMEMALPTLAICRGMQVLNVALGGVLHQHLPELTDEDHGTDGDALHGVRVDGASRLASVCGTQVAGCASHHHQGVERLGRGLVAVGWSEGGVIEALEAGGDGEVPWVVAVQWHPERTAARDPVQQDFFDALVRVASGPDEGVK